MNSQRTYFPHLTFRVLESADILRRPVGATGVGPRVFPSRTTKCTFDAFEHPCRDIVGLAGDEDLDRLPELHRCEISEDYGCDGVLPKAEDFLMFGAPKHWTEN